MYEQFQIDFRDIVYTPENEKDVKRIRNSVGKYEMEAIRKFEKSEMVKKYENKEELLREVKEGR